MKGFTLVEMMVALLIFGLVSAAGVALMTFSTDNQETVRGHAERLSQLQRTRALLKADLSQAAARPTRGLDGRAAPAAFGPGVDGALLAFVRRGWDNPDRAARASLQYVEYRLVEDRLERRTRAALDGAPLGPPQRLVAGVRSAKVAYAHQGQWLEALPAEAQGAPPQAVRVDLELADYGPVRQLFLVSGEAP